MATKLNRCSKCKLKPDVLQVARLTVIKCFHCGQAETSIRGKKEAVAQWNEFNPLPAPPQKEEGK